MSDPGPSSDPPSATASAAKPSTTLYVKGLPLTAQSSDLETFFSEYGPIRQCFVVANSADKSKNRGFGFVHFAVAQDALSALEQAKTRAFGDSGKPLTLELAKPRDKLEDRTSKKRTASSAALPTTNDNSQHATVPTAAAASDTLAVLPDAKKPRITPTTTARLIVRNLSFKCTPATLRATFSTYGTVTECAMPRKFEPNGPYRGFGIVQFSKRADAQRALDAMNEKEICGRAVAVDWCIPQVQFLVAEGVDKDEVARRLQEKFEKGKGRLDTDLGIVVDDKDQDKKQDDSDSNAGSDSGDDDEEDQDEDDDSDAMSVDDDDVDDPKNQTQVTPRGGGGGGARLPMPTLDAGTTVFIRNVPFDASEADLHACFSHFGPLVYAKITKDKDTGKSKGTAFACYTTKDHADACLAEAAKTNDMAYAMTTTAAIGSSSSSSSATAPPTSSSSLLTPDLPATLSTSTLILHGRLLNVTRAVSRDLAATLTAKERLKRERRDKRNTYLLLEGWQGDLADRRAALDGNHALFVSRTRVALRRVPLHVGDSALRAFATAAARGYLQSVVALGKDTEWPLPEAETEAGALDPNKVRAWADEASAVKTVVRQAKVVRAKDRVGTDGQLRSKGFGFVEFADHLAALACVRALAKPEAPKVRRWVLEHLVEKEDQADEQPEEMQVDSATEDAIAQANALAEQDDDQQAEQGAESDAEQDSESDSDEDSESADAEETLETDADAEADDEDVPTHTPAGKPLPEIIVEFAIENRQIVNMRDAKLKRLQKAQQVQRANVVDRQDRQSGAGQRGGRGGRGGASRGGFRGSSTRGGPSGRGGDRGGRGGFRGGRGGAAGSFSGNRGGSASSPSSSSTSFGRGRGRGGAAGPGRGGPSSSFGRGGGNSRGGRGAPRGGNASRGGGRGAGGRGRGGRGGAS